MFISNHPKDQAGITNAVRHSSMAQNSQLLYNVHTGLFPLSHKSSSHVEENLWVEATTPKGHS